MCLWVNVSQYEQMQKIENDPPPPAVICLMIHAAVSLYQGVLQGAAKEQMRSWDVRDTVCHWGQAFINDTLIRRERALHLSTCLELVFWCPPVYKLILNKIH